MVVSFEHFERSGALTVIIAKNVAFKFNAFSLSFFETLKYLANLVSY